ncbi:alcohol dehydrogenase catalytic domain-containing protein [Thermogymnomonas acidicola]|nr:alcohol dehydrogenase catalytic domain-containing protein [Thermogymnomonas acidicola]
MKSMVLREIRKAEEEPLVMEDLDTPEPSENQILIRITSSGVCRSNLHMIEGDWVQNGVPARLPIIPGHEVIGRVEKVGENVDYFRKGDLAGVQPLWTACGRCEYCLSGRENLCPNKQVTGETLDGGYSEYMLADARYAYRIPAGIDETRDAPLFCPGVTAYRAVKQARLGPAKEVFIFGVGGVGHLAIQFAKLSGARVTAVSTGERHRDLALRVGADDVIDPGRDYSGISKFSRAADRAIVFAPSQAAIDAALKTLKPGGRLVLGVFGGASSIPFVDEIEIVGSVIGTRKDMNEVLRLASTGKVRIEAERYRLDQANEVLLRLKRGQINGRAVLNP